MPDLDASTSSWTHGAIKIAERGGPVSDSGGRGNVLLVVPNRSAPASVAATRPRAVRGYVMCPPTYFAVSYRINPWMDPARPVRADRALRQWQDLHDTLTALGHRIDLVPPEPGLPDMVFAANGGIVIGDRALVPRFRHPQRAAESAHFAQALTELGLAEVRVARHVNEGEGDFLLAGGVILAGTGQRSDPDAPAEVSQFFGLPAVPLTLVDPRFYHLDTALAVLDDETIAYWPGAFDRAAQDVLRQLYPDAILADETDATRLGLNMISDGTTVLTAPGGPQLAARIAERGFTVTTLPTDELGKSGGGAKCCVLSRHRAPQASVTAGN